MTKSIVRLTAVLMLLGVLQGCSTIQHETALEWLARQPWMSDSPGQ